MERRKLGNTGMETSLLGFGGFHLLETAAAEVDYLLNSYLNKGGNYIETAPGYGDGLSERKIGRAVSSRRKDYILATKNHQRKGKEVMETLERSLKNLQTDSTTLLMLPVILEKNICSLHQSPTASFLPHQLLWTSFQLLQDIWSRKSVKRPKPI